MDESLFWLIYWIGCFLACFPVTWAVATQFGTEDMDTESILMGLLMSVCTAWFWPLAIPLAPVYFAVKGWGK